MKYLRWVIITFAWIIAVGLAIAAAQGISSGSAGWAALLIFGFAYLLQQTTNKVERLERQIARLEDEMGKHQKFHGHYTNY